MLSVFKTGLDHRLSSAKLPASVAQSLQTQSIKLAAIDIPKNVKPGMQQAVRRVIDESFVSGFRWVTAIAAMLAAASAVATLFWIAGSPTARPVGKRSTAGR